MGLRIKLLGQFEVYRDGHPIAQTEWRTERNKDVLKILALYPNQTLPRDWIMESLWPAQNPERSVRNLRGRISEIRRILEPHLFQGSESTYVQTLSNGYALAARYCRIDTQAFQEAYDHAVTQAKLDSHTAIDAFRRAIEIYIGDLLPADRHKEWTFDRREELRRRYLDALRQLTDLLYREQQYEEAIRYGEKSLQVDPHDERVYRTLMRTHHEIGNAHETLQLYERCRQALATSDMAPSEATDHLAATLRSHAYRHSERISMDEQLRVIEERLASEPSPAARWDLMGQQLELLHALRYRAKEARALEAAQGLARDLADPSKLGRVLVKWAEYHRALGNLDAAERSAQEAHEQFAVTEDQLGIAEAVFALGQCRFERHDIGTTRERCEQALRQIRIMDNYRADQLRVRIWNCLGRLAVKDLAYDVALQYYDQALRLCQSTEDDPQQARLFLNLGSLHYYRNRVAEAWLHWDYGRRIAQRIGHDPIEAKCLINLAALKKSRADLAEAWRIIETVIDLQERLHDVDGLAKSWNNLGAIHDALGRPNQALAAFRRSRAYSREADNDLGVAIADMAMASVHIPQARFDDARQRLRSAQATFRSHSNTWYETQALYYLGELELARGRPTEAKRLMDDAQRLAEGVGSRKLREYAQAALAETERELGQRSAALEWAEIVESSLAQTPPGIEDTRVCYRLYRVLRDAGMADRAGHHLHRAHALVSHLATQLSDTSQRDEFQRVPLYREIMAAYDSEAGPTGSEAA